MGAGQGSEVNKSSESPTQCGPRGPPDALTDANSVRLSTPFPAVCLPPPCFSYFYLLRTNASRFIPGADFRCHTRFSVPLLKTVFTIPVRFKECLKVGVREGGVGEGEGGGYLNTCSSNGTKTAFKSFHCTGACHLSLLLWL